LAICLRLDAQQFFAKIGAYPKLQKFACVMRKFIDTGVEKSFIFSELDNIGSNDTFF
jgi:hypothetical protein